MTGGSDIGAEAMPVAMISDRFRLALAAREAALSVAGVSGTDIGPLNLFMTVGQGQRLEGVVCAASSDGGFDVSLRLACELVPLPGLIEHVRLAVRAAAAGSSLQLDRLDIQIAQITGPGAPR